MSGRGFDYRSITWLTNPDWSNRRIVKNLVSLNPCQTPCCVCLFCLLLILIIKYLFLSLFFPSFTETKIGSNRYIYYKNFISWFSAQKFCRKHHTDLTTSKDQTEFTTINQNVGDPSWLTWIGLIQDFWVWSDGSNSTIVPWMVGEPDDAAYDENCGYLFSSETGDAVCSNMMPFFCYGSEFKRSVVYWNKQNVCFAVSTFTLYTRLTTVMEPLFCSRLRSGAQRCCSNGSQWHFQLLLYEKQFTVK